MGKRQSSTWRELEAVNIVLHHNVSCTKGKHLQVVTDNKNVKRILDLGSKRTGLY